MILAEPTLSPPRDYWGREPISETTITLHPCCGDCGAHLGDAVIVVSEYPVELSARSRWRLRSGACEDYVAETETEASDPVWLAGGPVCAGEDCGATFGEDEWPAMKATAIRLAERM